MSQIGKSLGMLKWLAALALTLPAGNVFAANYQFTYDGHITSGFDSTGTFGQVQSLGGLPFLATFVLTIPTAGALVDTNGTSFLTVNGGANFGTVATPLTGTITINGVTRASSGNLAGSFSLYNNFNGSLDLISTVANEGFQDSTTNTARIINIGVGSLGSSIVNSIDPADGASYTVQPADFATGNFRFLATHVVDNGSFLQTVFDEDVTGDVLVDSLTVSAISAAPEPAGWAMMIVGFGLAGVRLRRPQRLLKAA